MDRRACTSVALISTDGLEIAQKARITLDLVKASGARP